MSCILPTNEEYMKVAEGSIDRLKELCSNIDQWKLNKSSGSGDELVEVFIKDSDIKGAEEMYLLRTTYRTSVANLAALLYPWYPYRLKWDTLLESGEIIKKFAENNFIISHRTRGKYTLSARESVDAVKIVKEGINMYFASTCAPCGDVLVPIHDKYVRTTQYLGGYRLIQIDENRVEFCMLFHADLKLPIPKFLSSIVSSLKPKLMIEKVDNLRKAVKAMPVQAEHLDHQ